jgi:NitT/TauT family transport system permease protein
MQRPVIYRRIWGEATALLQRARQLTGVDLLIVLGLAGLLYGLLDLAKEWAGPHRPVVEITLSPTALPKYAFYSLMRGLLAYILSLGFTLLYGYWAAKDRVAERVLIPLLDILQSIPVLGFLPGLVLGLTAAFPHSNVGLELAAIVMIFTGQVWNMTFSFYQSLRSLPQDMQEVAAAFRLNWWQRLRWLELPGATMGLVWNSMMSMAGGWFFLMINETYHLGDRDFRLPGLGSYMSVAVEQGRVDAMLWAILAMTLLIVALDQLLWRPLVVWAQKFRIEETGTALPASSWFLTWLRRSTLIAGLRRWLRDRQAKHATVSSPLPLAKPYQTGSPRWTVVCSWGLVLVLVLTLGWGAWQLSRLLRSLAWSAWPELVLAAMATLARVLISTLIGTLWAVPVGLAIGLQPTLARWLQPVVQVAASFPAPMLFPLVIAGLRLAGISLDWGSLALMLLGTQWYILFNVVAGAMSVPADLREVAHSYRLNIWQRLRILYLPAIFPHLVTGWVTAAGGAWNASIVAEYVSAGGETLQAYGLGAKISWAAEHADFPLLAAGVLVMAGVVVLFNRLVWRRLYQLAETRFSLSK